MIKISYLDDVHCKVECEASIAQELSDFFTFEVPGAKFMPQVRNRVWDGKIRLFNQVTRTIEKSRCVPHVTKTTRCRDSIAVPIPHSTDMEAWHWCITLSKGAI